jgi:hypothetical protein
MILLGCLLVIGFSVAPRVMLALAWLFSDRWPIVWGDNWLAPLLGIIFLPYTTIMYLLVWAPNGIQGWDWIWIALGLLLDVMHWAQYIEKRKQVPGYSTVAATGSGSASTGTMAAAYAPPTSSVAASSVPVAAAPAAAAASSQASVPPEAAPPVLSGEVVQPVTEPEDVSPDNPPPGA